MSRKHYLDALAILKSATGSIRFNMTNDYMFKEVLQQNTRVLKGLIASLLHLKLGGVKSVTITNPIEPGDKIVPLITSVGTTPTCIKEMTIPMSDPLTRSVSSTLHSSQMIPVSMLLISL